MFIEAYNNSNTYKRKTMVRKKESVREGEGKRSVQWKEKSVFSCVTVPTRSLRER